MNTEDNFDLFQSNAGTAVAVHICMASLTSSSAASGRDVTLIVEKVMMPVVAASEGAVRRWRTGRTGRRRRYSVPALYGQSV